MPVMRLERPARGLRRTPRLLGGGALVVVLMVAGLLGCVGSVPAERAPAAAHSGAPVRAGPVVPEEAKAATGESGWLVASDPKLRELTVVVKVSPPPELQARYRELAGRYRSLEPLFSAAAGEGFGSGFVMVRRKAGGGPGETFVVTNRHVVGLASEATVMLGERAVHASVAYVDDRYDLAILSLGELRASAGPHAGAALDLVPARDQDAVVASGYPGIEGNPSYQVTRGYVSNEQFTLEGDDYVQHTAAIDPGSSGGPLFGASGAVLGVNTLKIRGREAVGLAVPAKAIELAFERVFALRTGSERASADELAHSACEALALSLGEENARITALEVQLGSRLVAENGLSSLSALPREDADWQGLLLHDPTSVFLRAVAFRLRRWVSEPVDGERCKRMQPAQAGARSFRVKLGGAERSFTFMLEQSRWKLVESSLPPATGGSFLDSAKAPPKWKPRLK